VISLLFSNAIEMQIAALGTLTQLAQTPIFARKLIEEGIIAILGEFRYHKNLRNDGKGSQLMSALKLLVITLKKHEIDQHKEIHQHYLHDLSPIWVKFHNEELDEFTFVKISVEIEFSQLQCLIAQIFYQPNIESTERFCSFSNGNGNNTYEPTNTEELQYCMKTCEGILVCNVHGNSVTMPQHASSARKSIFVVDQHFK